VDAYEEGCRVDGVLEAVAVDVDAEDLVGARLVALLADAALPWLVAELPTAGRSTGLLSVSFRSNLVILAQFGDNW
jgi:hypothetical protein